VTKLAVNQVQDGQGFQAHITAAHPDAPDAFAGEADPYYALRIPDGRRRPMVQKAFEHYEARKTEQDRQVRRSCPPLPQADPARAGPGRVARAGPGGKTAKSCDLGCYSPMPDQAALRESRKPARS
jgi:hypothetical protein